MPVVERAKCSLVAIEKLANEDGVRRLPGEFERRHNHISAGHGCERLHRPGAAGEGSVPNSVPIDLDGGLLGGSGMAGYCRFLFLLLTTKAV